MLINRSLEDMLTGIGRFNIVIDETLVPEKNGSYRVEGKGESPAFDDVERRLLHHLAEVTKTKDDGSVLQEAIANAFGRGNLYDPKLPVKITMYVGEDGCIVRIQDSGEGFDFRKKIKQKRAGENYYQNYGIGLKCLDSKGLDASYEGNGSVLNIFFRKD